MFNGKMKAVTFSYDDGTTQDKRLVELFDKYGLKATFNINSELLGRDGSLVREGKTVNHTKISKTQAREIYKGHEIAVHTLTHPNLTMLGEDEITRQVEEDRKNLTELAGYEVVGMAYPCGGENNNDFVAGVIKSNTRVKYARTITPSYCFDVQENPLRFNPTVHHVEWERLFALAQEFTELGENLDKPQIFYIWGHSFEFDIHDTWSRFEEFCRLIGGRDDIFYGTNKEVLLY